MPEIILTTLNAKYIHASFGLRYLLANMGELQQQTELIEFDIKSNPSDIAEDLLQRNPKIVGLGIYIWNAEQCLKVVRLLKQLKPEIKLILGGPEVSYEYQDQSIVESADFLITGEADFEFSELC
ncbi:MAG TPA: cobalamin B12-binding domain-containing protein, partial [Verrucomicrobia bacterium]|nr:cobalamin B12-binding domain-containing protein [Verrucomicrobiota bacterium]